MGTGPASPDPGARPDPRRPLRRRLALSLAGVALLSACGGRVPPAAPPVTPPPTNVSPVVELRCESPAVAGRDVVCQAAASDPDGDPLSISWQVDGAAVGATGGTLAVPAPAAGSRLDVRVEASDGRGGVAVADRQVHVLKAVAGGPRTFPWRPPQWTTRAELPRRLVFPPGDETYGAAADRVRSALVRGGFLAWSVYPLPLDAGFAFVAQMERIGDDALPLAGQRWLVDSEPPLDWSISELLRRLVTAPIGRYRVIAIVVTTLDVSPGPTPPDIVTGLPDQGGQVLSPGIRRKRVPPEQPPTCAALVYEFLKRRGLDPKPLDVGESGLGALRHVAAAGLWSGKELQP